MKPDATIFPTAWLSFDLPGYRACDSTYCFFPYEELPALEDGLFRGEFQWLTELAQYRQQAMEIYQQVLSSQLEDNLTLLLAAAQKLNVRLPAPFVKFMGAAALQKQIPSCTACYFDLPERIVPSPMGDKGYIIRFLNDQQGVLFWYLYLSSTGQECVLVSPILFDSEMPGEISQEGLIRQTGFCSETFEAFIYRFWLENTLWFALSGGEPLTPEQKRYLEHYQNKAKTS